MDKSRMQGNRSFLKDSIRLEVDFSRTDQNLGMEPPPVQKPPRAEQELIRLPDQENFRAFSGTDLITAIADRCSHRRFHKQPLSLTETAFLLWATQGIREVLGPGFALRTVPSAGCRHAFESYLLVSDVETLENGVYRYLPLEHALVFEHRVDNMAARLTQATLGQAFIATAPATFVWAVVPYRMEWRYDLAAHRVVGLDAGHLCQNLYLACKAIGAGTCAIAAYHQVYMDRLLGIDGDDEFTLYLAPVGKV